ADVLDDIRGHAIDRRCRQPAVGPLKEARMPEADELCGGLPLARALHRKILRRPGTELLAEPASLVAAREREQRCGVPLRGELHRRSGNAEGLVIWMGVDEQRGADGVTLA